MTVCRGSLFMTQIEQALYEEPASSSCTALCSQQCSWGSSAPSGLLNSDQLSQRCVTVLMELYLMQEWCDISYGFHNSQAMWPNNCHAWQQLLLHSLTKLGVHWVGVYWVCVHCKTCNMQCTFRTLNELHLFGKVDTPTKALGKK